MPNISKLITYILLALYLSISTALAQETDWGGWASHPAYPGIEFSVRYDYHNNYSESKGRPADVWQVRFRHNYAQSITISHALSEPNVPFEIVRDWNGITVGQGEVRGTGLHFLNVDYNPIWVWIRKVTLADGSALTPAVDLPAGSSTGSGTGNSGDGSGFGDIPTQDWEEPLVEGFLSITNGSSLGWRANYNKELLLGQDEPRIITVRNPGDTFISFTASLEYSDRAEVPEWLGAGTGSFDLSPGQEQQIPVQFIESALEDSSFEAGKNYYASITLTASNGQTTIITATLKIDRGFSISLRDVTADTLVKPLSVTTPWQSNGPVGTDDNPPYIISTSDDRFETTFNMSVDVDWLELRQVTRTFMNGCTSNVGCPAKGDWQQTAGGTIGTSQLLVEGAALRVEMRFAEAGQALPPGSYYATITATNGPQTHKIPVFFEKVGGSNLILTKLDTNEGWQNPLASVNTDIREYKLYNAGDTALDFTISSSASPWLEISPASGTVEGKESTVISLSLNESVAAFNAGNYLAEVYFSNDSNNIGSELQKIPLSVYSGSLAVSEISGFPAIILSDSIEAGTTSDVNIELTPSNQDPSAQLNVDIQTDANWINISTQNLVLAPLESQNISLSVNDTASTLAPGNYRTMVHFNNTDNATNYWSTIVELIVTDAGAITPNTPPTSEATDYFVSLEEIQAQGNFMLGKPVNDDDGDPLVVDFGYVYFSDSGSRFFTWDMKSQQIMFNSNYIQLSEGSSVSYESFYNNALATATFCADDFSGGAMACDVVRIFTAPPASEFSFPRDNTWVWSDEQQGYLVGQLTTTRTGLANNLDEPPSTIQIIEEHDSALFFIANNQLYATIEAQQNEFYDVSIQLTDKFGTNLIETVGLRARSFDIPSIPVPVIDIPANRLNEGDPLQLSNYIENYQVQWQLIRDQQPCDDEILFDSGIQSGGSISLPPNVLSPVTLNLGTAQRYCARARFIHPSGMAGSWSGKRTFGYFDNTFVDDNANGVDDLIEGDIRDSRFCITPSSFQAEVCLQGSHATYGGELEKFNLRRLDEIAASQLPALSAYNIHYAIIFASKVTHQTDLSLRLTLSKALPADVSLVDYQGQNIPFTWEGDERRLLRITIPDGGFPNLDGIVNNGVMLTVAAVTARSSSNSGSGSSGSSSGVSSGGTISSSSSGGSGGGGSLSPFFAIALFAYSLLMANRHRVQVKRKT